MSYDHYYTECKCGWFGYFRDLSNNHNNCPRCNAYRQWVATKPHEIVHETEARYFISTVITISLIFFVGTVYTWCVNK